MGYHTGYAVNHGMITLVERQANHVIGHVKKVIYPHPHWELSFVPPWAESTDEFVECISKQLSFLEAKSLLWESRFDFAKAWVGE